ncbi:MAG: hypothetical protein GY849_22170 [Deltaproteobacteria bacterium]|nr:hypothetical protein [Deltaproteobacteria bacterium]
MLASKGRRSNVSRLTEALKHSTVKAKTTLLLVLVFAVCCFLKGTLGTFHAIVLLSFASQTLFDCFLCSLLTLLLSHFFLGSIFLFFGISLCLGLLFLLLLLVGETLLLVSLSLGLSSS